MTDPNHYADMYNAYEKTPKKIRILDSTLREGEQHPGVSFTNKQRIQIAWMLDYFGVDQIEIAAQNFAKSKNIHSKNPFHKIIFLKKYWALGSTAPPSHGYFFGPYTVDFLLGASKPYI